MFQISLTKQLGMQSLPISWLMVASLNYACLSDPQKLNYCGHVECVYSFISVRIFYIFQLNVLSSYQALPYVILLIAMLFFIYAIIGMQVRNETPSSVHRLNPRFPSTPSPSISHHVITLEYKLQSVINQIHLIDSISGQSVLMASIHNTHLKQVSKLEFFWKS